MIQKDFATRALQALKEDPAVVGMAIGGSWVTNELDEYSDLDLILFTRESLAKDKGKMEAYARRLGDLLSCFTGEHVGEPRLLVCLYDNPLLHVDIKFLAPAEFTKRVENPVILFDRDGSLTAIMNATAPVWPLPDYQWIEDRFWIWVHYVSAKIGRGEFFDVLSSLDFLRANVLSPLMQVKNKKKPRALRKVETELGLPDLENLKITIAGYKKESLISALDNTISIYRSLRKKLFPETIILRTETEKQSMGYFKKIKKLAAQ